jgi:flagellin
MPMPGEAPADLGISERFRAQIRNSEEAGRVIQNAINMFSTADAWLQETHNLLDRMSELAVSAADGSKNDGDRQNLDLEFQQLKQEIARIAESGKYNGIQTNGSTAVATYDYIDHTVKYYQADGSTVSDIGVNLANGNSSANGIAYGFEDTNGSEIGNFLFTKDGKSMLYVFQGTTSGTATQFQTLMKLDLATNTVTAGANLAAVNVPSLIDARSHFVMDDEGKVWISNTNAQGEYGISLLDVESMTLDAGGGAATNEWAGTATTINRGEFAVHGDYLYYIDNNDDYVKQSLFDQNDSQILIDDIGTTNGAFGANAYSASNDLVAISHDGLYLAYEDITANGTLRVVNTETQEVATVSAGSSTSTVGIISDISFDSNNNIYWTDTGTTNNANALKRAKIAFGDTPTISDVEVLNVSNLGRFGQSAGNAAATTQGLGLSIAGGSPASSFQFQVGADKGMTVTLNSSDVQLVDLGVSRLSVNTIDKATEAIEMVSKAIDEVANQRAVLGAQVSRLNFTQSANASYGNNISQAESRIRDVDFASETAKLTTAQIMAQTSASMLSQANLSRQTMLSLLPR